mgnify:FL=1
MKNLAKISLVTLSFSLLLTGCTSGAIDKTSGDIPLTEDYNVSTLPNWADSSMKVLEAEKWQVSKMENMLPAKEGSKVPALYTATNEDSSCTIIYNVGGVEPTSGETQDSYAMTEQAVSTISFDSNNKIESQNTDAYINVDNDAKLQLLSVKYIRTLDTKKQNSITAFRVLSDTVPSPYSPEVFPTDTLYPKIDITYSCSDKKLDMNLWNKVLDSATLAY